MARQGVEHSLLRKSLVASAVPLALRFNALELANSPWAVATLHVIDRRWFEAKAAPCMSAPRQFPPTQLASTLWSVAPMRVRHQPCLYAISA
eukprot:NODE_4430_length_1893_cov_3.176670.p5 GENE.NODE_4430_length_1893_cov_3.176670~~NODE_4430_length_1893_cov_3.176670.p5  ORF type:complete len:92 (-),score=19.43 NODE_4430_length_1893_cov_3.176670:632-907(-)